MRVALLLWALANSADIAESSGLHDSTPSYGSAHIIVTINPEARVNAVMGAPLPSPRTCGSSVELKLKVINHGFVTAPLRASIIGERARHIALNMEEKKLSGGLEENRVVRLTPTTALADITVAFDIDNNVGSQRGHNRVHFVIRCL